MFSRRAFLRASLGTSTLVALAQECAVDAGLAERAMAVRKPVEPPDLPPQAGVPHFVFDRRWSLSGAQPPHVLLSAVRRTHAQPSPQEETR